jgi:hypothetical protein
MCHLLCGRVLTRSGVAIADQSRTATSTSFSPLRVSVLLCISTASSGARRHVAFAHAIAARCFFITLCRAAVTTPLSMS